MSPFEEPTPEERSRRIRECFQRWDAEGKGFITKADLKAVLNMLMPGGEKLSSEEIDELMVEADRNGNGKIEYHEFVDWLTRPGSTVHAGAGEVSYFDLEALLRPLFRIYDRNGDGSITPEEFAECHNILQTALTLHPTDGKSVVQDPEMLSAESSRVFKQVDQNADHRVCFEEFVDWQRSSLEKSGLLNDDLVDLLPALTRQLGRVFNLAETNEQGNLMSNDQNVLLHITKNVATFVRDLYNEDEAGHSSLRGRKHYTNRWSDPPAGLNVDRLKGLHLATAAVPLWGVEDTEFVVVCVPERQQQDTVRTRRWYARVVRKVTFRTGRIEQDDPHYYIYEGLLWTRDQALVQEFSDAYNSLPPELRIFCHIKTAGNFGLQISWDRTQSALRECVKEKLLTEAQVGLYNAHVEDQIVNAMRESGSKRLESREELHRLRELSMQAPRSIMAALAELGILKVSSVWADVLKA